MISKRQPWMVCALAVAVLAGACSNPSLRRPPPSAAATGEPVPAAAAAPAAVPGRAPAPEPAPATRPQRMQPIRELGSGDYIAHPEQPAVAASEDGDITINFPDTDLREFIKVILGDILQLNYVVDAGVGGRVTVETARPVTRENLFPLFEEILSMNGAVVVESGGLYKVLPREQGVQGNLAPRTVETPGQDGFGVRIIPLQYVAASEMESILEPFISTSGKLRTDTKRNLLIVSGTRQELDLIQETIGLFDVDWMRGMSMGLYPLEFVDPKTLKDELDSVIGAMDETAEAGKLLGGMVRTVPVERLNALLLISSTPAALRELETWLRRLDQPGEFVGKRLYVYHVQNAKAVDLADILAPVFGAAGSRQGGAKPVQLAPGLSRAEVGSAPADQPNRETPATRATEGINLPAGDSIQIIADDVRNALVVLATPEEYKMVEAAIKQLDVVPLQVLIEASIIEVSLTDDLSYGVEWFFNNDINLKGERQGIATLDLGDSGISAKAPGFSYIIQDAAGVNLALNALQSESRINVLSSPSLMVLDNQTATINVGDEIPIPSRQSISNLDPNAPTVNEIQYRKTGVTLTVTPRVNSGGLVTMEITQEVSTADITDTSNIDAPTIKNRQVESVVAINSGETIMLGGLIQNNETRGDSGIPGLKNLPLLGKLFSTNTDNQLRTELLILITPRVVSNRNDAREITDEFRRKLRGIAPLTPVDGKGPG